MNDHLENRDIILFSLKPWDTGIGSSSKKYARVFAHKNNRVLFINRALDRMSVLKFRDDPKTRNRLQSLKLKDESLVEVEKNIWTLNPLTVLESINKIPIPFIFDWLNKINNKRLAKEINKAANKLEFSNIVLYIENDFIRAQYLQDLIEHLDCTIYYIRDYLPSQAYFRVHGKRLEPKLIKKSNVVITNSLFLKNYAEKYNPKSYFVGQGCDTELFSGLFHETPYDMRQISGPVIGYTGALLATRLDIRLIKEIAVAYSQSSVVLVGPEDEIFKKSDLHRINNIYFLGQKKMEDLPKYVAGFDVCINPQVVNDMTKGNYPLKIDEYLAMGKEVVATRTEAMEMFDGYVKLASSTHEFLHCIGQALYIESSKQEIERKIAFARSHTWENCVFLLEQALSEN